MRWPWRKRKRDDFDIHMDGQRMGDAYRDLVADLHWFVHSAKENNYSRINTRATLLLNGVPSDLARAVVEQAWGYDEEDES